MFVFTFSFLYMFEIEIRCDYSFFYLWLLKLQLQFCAKNSLGRPHPFACRQTVGWFPTSRWCGGRNGVRSVIEFTIEFTIDFPHHRIEIVFFFGFLRLFHFALPAAHKNKNKEHWSGTATKQQPPHTTKTYDGSSSKRHCAGNRYGTQACCNSFKRALVASMCNTSTFSLPRVAMICN